MDMHFEWLIDREAKKQFRIYWRSGKTNLADYFTKHHPPSHHWNIRGDFLTKVAELHRLRLQQKGNIDKALSIIPTYGGFHTVSCKGVLNPNYKHLRFLAKSVSLSEKGRK